MNFQVERLKRLPQRKDDVWQGGLTRIPAWVEEGESGGAYRPWLAGWLSLKTRYVHTSVPKRREETDLQMALDCLLEFSCNEELAGYRPGRVEVKDEALAKHLGPLLEEAGIEVQQRKKLFMFDEVIADLGEHLEGKAGLPDALEAKGVTVEIMRSFAEASSELYEAKLWEQLGGEDLVEIESPSVGSAFRYFSVLGAGKMTFGLGFYWSPDEFESLMDGRGTDVFRESQRWAIYFEPMTQIPFGDADLWEDYELPVAGDGAYPVAGCWDPRGKHRRPGPEILVFMEGLMRALARTTEDEIDSGRWEKTVETWKGPMEFVMSLPGLLEEPGKDSEGRTKGRPGIPDRRLMEQSLAQIHRALEGGDFADADEMNAFLNKEVLSGNIAAVEPTGSLEKAQELMYQAVDSVGRKRVQLARKALKICPDCADAYVILAEQSGDEQKAHDLYAQGVAAGERGLGPAIFEEDAGRFWGILETRPYMRARLGLAEILEAMGRLEEAADHYREMLRLNQNDNQGVRHMLVPCLLEMGCDDEAEEILKRYKADFLALWTYPRALVTFRKKGDTATARKHLRKAIEENEYVPHYLLGRRDWPIEFPSSYSPGSGDEAILCADVLADVWQETPGAIEWLEEQLEAKPTRKSTKKRTR
ncbi:MAG: tetratricopeptide repeat protein [Phycisphaerae bacterium]|nr:tetratricopeptide repeat protein [Phycisphaerae bacterium]